MFTFHSYYRNVNLKWRDTILNLSEWQKMLSLVTASIDTDTRENWRSYVVPQNTHTVFLEEQFDSICKLFQVCLDTSFRDQKFFLWTQTQNRAKIFMAATATEVCW